jgi:hypothetical protein
MLALTALSCERTTEEPNKKKFAIDKKYERGPVTASLKVDRDDITIADRITLIIEATATEDYEVQLPSFGEKLQEFGIVDYETAQPRLVEGGRIRTARSYVLEPFLSGEYAIPPMKIIFWKKGEEERHEFETEELAIKVKSLLPEKYGELKIKDIAGPVELPRSARPWLYAVGAACIVLIAGAGALTFYLRRRRRVRKGLERMSAHERAYLELERLLSEELIEKGRVKLFYFRLTDILRHYIENRFGLHAPEQTTEEFLSDLRKDGVLASGHRQLLEEFLRHSDLVKFAEHQPAAAEVQKTFDTCKEFVFSTKLEEEASNQE